jgi:hypothetical protein
MYTPLGCGAFASDHAVTHDGQRMSGGLAAGWFKDAEGFNAIGLRGEHS